MRVLRIIAVAALCVVLAIVVLHIMFWCWLHVRPRPSPAFLPPDLSDCIRIEIRYPPFAFAGYPVWNDEAEKSLLTPEEAQHVEMLLQSVLDDPERIRAFARTIASGSYDGVTSSGSVTTKVIASVLCRFSDGPPISLTLYHDVRLVTEDGQVFKHKIPVGTLDEISSQVRSSELLPQIRLRIGCARNLEYLYSGLRGFEDHVVYPSSLTWCETLIDRHLQQGDREKEVRRHLECPAVWNGSYNYAMNPDCKPDSPPDTVLLFETKAGWNQHGGPELFTFDNHDPRGGLVLLNDGSVRFVRTEEELKQLRWK